MRSFRFRHRWQRRHAPAARLRAGQPAGGRRLHPGLRPPGRDAVRPRRLMRPPQAAVEHPERRLDLARQPVRAPGARALAARPDRRPTRAVRA